MAQSLAKAKVRKQFQSLIPIAVENSSDWGNALVGLVTLYDDIDALCGAAQELGVQFATETNEE